MATKKTATYEIVLAHAGRTDDTVVETVTTGAGVKAYNAVLERAYEMTTAITDKTERAYYAVRRAGNAAAR